MNVNISPRRIIHLLLLILFTYLLGQVLIVKLDWTPLSAYGFGCTIVVQINNGILWLFDKEAQAKSGGLFGGEEVSSGGEGSGKLKGRERMLDRRKLGGDGGSRKKNASLPIRRSNYQAASSVSQFDVDESYAGKFLLREILWILIMKQSSIERTDLRLRELSRRMYQVSESYQAAVLCVSPRATTEMVGSDCSIVACASVWR
ncbi:predicted protein [Thalassiosira pseudonana CCMP1335]|uniref:Uncharacterized protein n=1 Tax=Thalassiosira pseudonana TaxID=35128 RepID=B5YM61_THAPS|nr:predicted protein [Thalassiosira pseudonana CCMP1335]ACI64194.1 predicted protein [Thalassiosira pseudonana CCMP1335]